MIVIRWRVLLSPICWVRGHRTVVVDGGNWGRPYDFCTRCLAEVGSGWSE